MYPAWYKLQMRGAGKVHAIKERASQRRIGNDNHPDALDPARITTVPATEVPCRVEETTESGTKATMWKGDAFKLNPPRGRPLLTPPGPTAHLPSFVWARGASREEGRKYVMEMGGNYRDREGVREPSGSSQRSGLSASAGKRHSGCCRPATATPGHSSTALPRSPLGPIPASRLRVSGRPRSKVATAHGCWARAVTSIGCPRSGDLGDTSHMFASRLQGDKSCTPWQ